MGCLYQIIVFPSHVDGPSGAGPIRILGVMKSRSVGLVKILPDTCAVVGLALEMFACMNSFKIAIGSFMLAILFHYRLHQKCSQLCVRAFCELPPLPPMVRLLGL